ncbi:MAG: YraN family protein, partial [Paludibacter sp.]
NQYQFNKYLSMAEHNELGNLGEERAQIFLKEKGYEILHTNWVVGKLELDIVAKKDNWLIVVEVKTRSTETFEHPEEAITLKKIRNIINATHEYIFEFDWNGETRFDVISVIPHGNEFLIDHIEDAFLSPSK